MCERYGDGIKMSSSSEILKDVKMHKPKKKKRLFIHFDTKLG